MKRLVTAIAATLVALVLATGARAVPVETSTDLNLRTGPGVAYPIVGTMPRGAIVELQGCDGSWCVVSYRGVRGWASGRYLIRIPFRPAPREGFLSRLFQPSRPAPIPVAPEDPLMRPLAPPPAADEAPREREQRARRPAETPAETSTRPGGGTAAPGILSEPAPSVRVPLPDESPAAEPADTGAASAPGRAEQPPATSAPAAAPGSANDAPPPRPRRLRREDASGSDVL